MIRPKRRYGTKLTAVAIPRLTAERPRDHFFSGPESRLFHYSMSELAVDEDEVALAFVVDRREVLLHHHRLPDPVKRLHVSVGGGATASVPSRAHHDMRERCPFHVWVVP
jgi:hypothetical protein